MLSYFMVCFFLLINFIQLLFLCKFFLFSPLSSWFFYRIYVIYVLLILLLLFLLYLLVYILFVNWTLFPFLPTLPFQSYFLSSIKKSGELFTLTGFPHSEPVHPARCTCQRIYYLYYIIVSSFPYFS